MNRKTNSHSRTSNNDSNDVRTRPTHRPGQSLKKARAEFKEHGPRLSSQEARQLARGAELLDRAERIRENERKRKAAAKKKQEKESREREARRRMGIPTQEKVYVSPRQGRVVDFLKVEKRKGSLEVKAPLRELQEKLGHDMFCGVEEPYSNGWQKEGVEMKKDVDDDPWELEDVDERSLLDTVENVRPASCSVISQEDSRLPLDKQDCPTKGSHHGKTDVEHQHRLPMQLLNPDDIWDDFVDSATQVQREISCESPPERSSHQKSMSPPQSPPLSTQDVAFTDDDLVELGLDSHDSLIESIPSLSTVSVPCRTSGIGRTQVDVDRDRLLMPPPIIPASKLVEKTISQLPAKPVLQSASATSLSSDLLEADFELSSQDCREIDGG
ncbi:MAG: hypothetical protein M1831_004706 [Alyxoria varia]|nr:MAG: hypothetical protein M1831_004706 [Alyxoria varia]